MSLTDMSASMVDDPIRHWTEWDAEVTDGYTILDPDGFRGGRPIYVTRAQFERARLECTLIRDESRPQWGMAPRSI